MQDITKWPNDLYIIRCAKLSQSNAHMISPPYCNLLHCDACGEAIIATTLTKSKQNLSGWKIICPSCYEKLPQDKVIYGGRIGLNQKEIDPTRFAYTDTAEAKKENQA